MFSSCLIPFTSKLPDSSFVSCKMLSKETFDDVLQGYPEDVRVCVFVCSSLLPLPPFRPRSFSVPSSLTVPVCSSSPSFSSLPFRLSSPLSRCLALLSLALVARSERAQICAVSFASCMERFCLCELRALLCTHAHIPGQNGKALYCSPQLIEGG